MAMTFATSNTLLGVLQPKSRTAQAVTAVAVAFLGSIVLTIAAKISVPVWPVPVSLQSMAVAIVAAAFGLRIGAATVALYLGQGLAGLPVFAGAYAGPAYLMGPTGGFLVGFLVMAVIVGYLADRGAARNVLTAFGAMMLGAAAMFALGFTWLLAMSGQAGWIDQSNLLVSAYKGAVEPFILWDTLKMAFAALTVVGGWALVQRRNA